MLCRSRRERSAPRLEVLEARILLSGEGLGHRPCRLSAWRTRADRPRIGAVEVADARVVRDPAAVGTGAVRGAGRSSAALIPNDLMIGLLWGLDNPRDVDIDAPQAWSVTTGSPSTI